MAQRKRVRGWRPQGPSGHVDSFTRDRLPPPELQAPVDYSALPALAAYPDRINAADVLLGARVRAGDGGRTAVLFAGRAWSYAELDAVSARIAHVLVDDLGLVPGNRVLLRAANNLMMAACWLAVLRAGGVCVATMPLLRARELTYIATKAEIRHALCDVALAAELEQTRAKVPALDRVSYFTATGDGGAGDADLDRRLAAKDTRFAAADTAADDVAIIAFTSGTTGQPKGCMHFHRDILAMCDCFPPHVFRSSRDDIVTGSPPLAFAFGLGGLLCFPMRVGAAAALVDKPSPEALLDAIARYRCTALYTAPTAYRALTGQVGGHDISSLRKCVSAGETLPAPTWHAWHEATGLKIIDGIGTTEMLHIFISSPQEEAVPGATGRVVPGYQACVLADDGAPAAAGAIGRLAVRGPTGCRYLDDVERQKGYVEGGWNITGDVYRQDEDGYFWYQARADDMIISAGYNIAGPEVEAALLEHADVLECGVVGEPDEKRGQIVAAHVVLRAGVPRTADTAKALQDFVKQQIAPYKYPRRVVFADALPRTETGKLQRFKLSRG
ncbi:MAG TPA: AMP-binding protein [Alphaproteobacteria bacterium]